MSKFTPGPWKIGAPPPSGEQTIGTQQGLMVAVATTGSGVPTEANARLIAAAPDLLEALEESFDFPADFFECDDMDAVTITVTGRHLRMVRAAIAKARGDA